MQRPTLGQIALRHWLDEAGVSDTTAWRWRRKGWLRAVNICGKLYLRAEDIAEFTRRAASGEFAKPPAGAARVCATARSAKEKAAV